MANRIQIPDLTVYKQSIIDLNSVARATFSSARDAKATLDEETSLSDTKLFDDSAVSDEVAAVLAKREAAAAAREAAAGKVSEMVSALLYDGHGNTRNLVPYLSEAFRQVALGMMPDPLKDASIDPGGFAYQPPPLYAIPIGGCVIDTPTARSSFWWGGVNNTYNTTAYGTSFPDFWSPRLRITKSGMLKQIVANMYLGLGNGTGAGSTTTPNVYVFDMDARVYSDISTAGATLWLTPMNNYGSPTQHRGSIQFVWKEPAYIPNSPLAVQQVYVKEGQYITLRTMVNTTTNGAAPFRLTLSGYMVGEWEK